MKKFFLALLLPAVWVAGGLPAQAHSSVQALTVAQASDVSAIAQDFVTLLAQADYSSALSKYNPAGGVSSSSLEQTWQDMVAANGELQQQLMAQVMGESGASQVVVITCQFEEGMRDVVVNFVDGQIVDFSVAESN